MYIYMLFVPFRPLLLNFSTSSSQSLQIEMKRIESPVQISALPKQGNRKDRKGKDMKGHLTCRVPRDEHHSIGGDLDAATPPNFGGDGSEGSWAVSSIEEIWSGEISQ